MAIVVPQNPRLSLAVLASIAAHIAIGWALMERTTIATLTEHGVPQVVTVRLRAPQPPTQPLAPALPTPVSAPAEPASPPPNRPKKAKQPTPTPAPAPPVALPAERAPVPATPLPVESVASTIPVAPPAPALPPRGVEEDVLSAYVAEVRSLILQQKRYPKIARKRGIEGRVEVKIRIGATGALSGIEVADGAPRILSRATEKAVRQAGPFPPPPQGSTVILLPIEYGLDDV